MFKKKLILGTSHKLANHELIAQAKKYFETMDDKKKSERSVSKHRDYNHTTMVSNIIAHIINSIVEQEVKNGKGQISK